MKVIFTTLSTLVLALSVISCSGGKKSTSNENQTSDTPLSQAHPSEAWQDFPFTLSFGKASEDGKHIVTEGMTLGDKLDRIYAFENKSLNILSHFDRRVIVVRTPVDTLSGDAYKVLYADDEDLDALSTQGGLATESAFFDHYHAEELKDLGFEDPTHPTDHLTKRAEELRPIIEGRYDYKIESIDPLCATADGSVVFYQATQEGSDDGNVLSLLIMDTEDGVVSYTEGVTRDPYAGRDDTDEVLRSCFPYPSVHTYLKGKDGSQLLILTDSNGGLGIYQLYKVDGETLIPYTAEPWHRSR